MAEFNGVLENQVSLQLFLYCLRSSDQVSLRQAQRDLGISSSSSVHWHLSKLASVGLIENRDSHYFATAAGKSVRKISLPVKESYFLINQQLVPSYIFNMSFLIFSIIITSIFVFINIFTAVIFSLLVLLTEFVLMFRRYHSLIDRQNSDRRTNLVAN